MRTVTELLDEAKMATGAETKYALSKALNLHSALISEYYAGNRTPDEYACLMIAKVTGRTYEEVSAIVRIHAEKNAERKKAWRDYYKSIGGAAASILLCVTFLLTPTPAKASDSEASDLTNLYYVK